MTDVYQPVIIKELLLNDGTCTKAELATALAGHDFTVQEYYERIVMRWPKLWSIYVAFEVMDGLAFQKP